MAHDTKKLITQSLAAIEKYKLFFIEDVVAYVSCSRATFYNHNLDKLDTIKDALSKNKIDIKVSMRNKWYKSESATLQIALMKMIATDDEAHRLNGSRQEIKHNANVNVSKLSNEAKKKIDDILNDEY
jgi:ACT domain-containing protein